MAEGVELLRHFWCCTDDFQRNEKIKTKLAQMRERLLSDMIPSTSTISLEVFFFFFPHTPNFFNLFLIIILNKGKKFIE